MSNLRSFIKGMRGLGIWSIILVLVFVVTTFGNPLSDSSAVEIEYLAEEILSFLISVTILSILVYTLVKIFFFFKRFRNKSEQFIDENVSVAPPVNSKAEFIGEELSLKQREFSKAELVGEEFSLTPEKFDKTIIEIVGRVESLLEEDSEYMQRVSEMEAVNQRYGIASRKVKYRHQRFFISSPLLEYSENIKIFYNTSYGQLELDFGSWVHIKGEYVHAPETGQFYGRIHYVHEPVGFVKQISVIEARKLIESVD